MQKALALIFLPLFLIGLASYCLADEVTLKLSSEGQWAVLDADGQETGTLAKVDEGAYSILPKGGQYLGIVRSNGDLQLTGRHPVISPSQAQLYLDVLDAIKTLK
ncbi:MAG: hypothetical protein ABSG91_00120 [Syntrophobacteraceae bacterium]|jgi:hypothetical protein